MLTTAMPPSSSRRRSATVFILEHSPSPYGRTRGHRPGETVFADDPIGNVIPGTEKPIGMPDYFALHKGSYRDSATLFQPDLDRHAGAHARFDRGQFGFSIIAASAPICWSTPVTMRQDGLKTNGSAACSKSATA